MARRDPADYKEALSTSSSHQTRGVLPVTSAFLEETGGKLLGKLDCLIGNRQGTNLDGWNGSVRKVWKINVQDWKRTVCVYISLQQVMRHGLQLLRKMGVR